MGTLKCLLFVSILVPIIRTGNCSNIKLNTDFNEKMREAKVNVAKSLFEASQEVFVNNYNVGWLKSWSTVWGVESPVTINTFDKMLLVRRNGSMEISIDASNSNRASKLNANIAIVQDYYKFIKFVRTIQWKTTLYILVCYYDDSCSLYTGNDISNLNSRQNIRQMGRITDAHFFTKANRLYLIVVYNLSYLLVSAPSIIYHWTGTYMDIVAQIMTNSAVSVTTFKHKQSIIIILAQYVSIDLSITSNVYEFNESGIKLIQFLPTYKPISVHHYSCDNYNFVLVKNEMKASSVYWWDGTELLQWIDIPEIKAHYSMQPIYLQDGTYFIVAHDNIVELFKLFSMTNYTSLSSRQLDDQQKIIDMHAFAYNANAKVILATSNREGLYFVETWDLSLQNKTSYGNSKMVMDSSQECLSSIIELLQKRMSIINNFQSFGLFSESLSLQNNFYDAIKFPNVVLKSGVVKRVDWFAEDEVLTPVKLREGYDDLASKIESISKNSLNLLKKNTKNTLHGTINVEEDAFFEDLHIDAIYLDKLNNVTYNPSNFISLKDDQSYESSLQAANIVVHDLKVDSLCGVPSNYWATMDNKNSKVLVSEGDDTREISNNSILVHSDITIPDLKVKKLNGTDMDKLIDQLFVIGGNQTITGNIIYDRMEVKNLTTKIYNGSPSILLLTNETDQNYYEFSMKNLEVDTLHVKLINGIPLTEFAMKSRKNVIEGEVTLNKIEIAEMLVMDPNVKISVIPSTQIYDDVLIRGNVTVKNFKFETKGKLIMDNLEIKPDSIFDNMWTKSSDQTIGNDITLDYGATIDRLETTYLNGFTEEEFLYTTVDKIPETFTNLHFENLHVNDTFQREGQNFHGFEVREDSIKIYGDLQIPSLSVNHLIANKFNNVPVDSILNNKDVLEVREDTYISALSVRRAVVRDLHLRSLNDRIVNNYLKMPIKINDSFVLGSMVVPKLHAKEIVTETLDARDISYLLKLRNMTIEEIVDDIVIDDDLNLSETLNTKIIDHHSTELYLEKKAREDIWLPTGLINELTVENITIDLLYGVKVDALPSSVFSKTNPQKIPGRFFFEKIRTKDLKASYVNGKDTSKLIWIDEPIVFSGNITFIDLFVDNDVSTESLNGYKIEQIYPSPLTIKSTKVFNLNVKNGHVAWENPNNDSKSLSSFFKKAIRKNKPQTIEGNVTFTKTLRAMSLVGHVEGIEEIKEIIEDTVSANTPKVFINGQKVFKNNLTVNTLEARNIIDIETVNGVNIVQLNTTVVNRHEADVVEGSIAFTNEVIVDKLIVNNTLHDISLTDLVLSNQVLPDNTYIQDLVILEDISLKSIDGIDFDEFVQDRVTLSQNHVIFADVQFQGLVGSTGDAIVKNINGVRTVDLLINGLRTTQIISGAKTFIDDLTVNGSVHSSLVNNINITEEFLNSVLNAENVTITGDVIFESHLNISKNITVSGLVNGVNVNNFFNNLDKQQNQSISDLKESEQFIENVIKQKALVVTSLPSVFSYLETENRLKIEVPNVSKIDVIVFGSIVKFNMYAEENGVSCGLPRDCICPLQYVAELAEKNCRVWRRNDTNIVRNFHEPNNLFGINVITSTVSYNAHCSRNETESEFTTFSWMTNEKYDQGYIANTRYSDLKIKGFLKDARVFTNNDQVFIVLAIYYDYTTKTHYTNSSIYKLNIENESLSLHQEIPTDGASAIEVFKINHDIYIVLACDGDTMNSSIYKLHADNSMFGLLRKFIGRSDQVKSLSCDDDYFVMLSDLDTNALNIYNYDHKSNYFNNYQSFFHDSRINGIQTFYTNDVGQSDAYVITTTEDGQFYIYEYMFTGKFQEKIVHRMDGIRIMVPFDYEQHHYVICGTRMNTTIMRIVQQGL